VRVPDELVVRLLQVQQTDRQPDRFGLLVEDFDGSARGGVDLDPAVVEFGDDLDLEVVCPDAVFAQVCEVVLEAFGVVYELAEEAFLGFEVVCDEGSELQVVAFVVVESLDWVREQLRTER